MLKKLTVEEKAALVSGTDFMFTNPVPRLSVKSIEMSDGPHGLRKQSGNSDNGISKSRPSTAFPTAATLACGWNEENLYKMGEAIALECAYYGVNVLLGPGANVKRNPLGGRNFEYFSEDAYLSGKLAAAEVKGIQSKGVSACVKHFALNNSENFRFMGNSICDMRAMREVYLRSFERVIKEGKPHTVMCAYNKINGTFCSENEWLLNGVLRGEWGFDGLVMTDWGATHDRVEGVKAGLDLEMPGDTTYCRKSIIDAVANGSLPVEKLDGAVERVLRLVDRSGKGGGEVDFDAHDKLSAEIAADCAVLLKNDGILPLKESESFFVCGELFEKMRYQGSGSSMINPTRLTPPKAAFDKRNIDYEYCHGYRESGQASDEKLLWEAGVRAEAYGKIIVFAGLTDYVESEGADRESMALPENQLELIDTLISTGKQVVVVLFGGSPVELPFADKVSAILNMSLCGQNGGTAVAELLFGDRTPSGRLAETWAMCYSDVPFGDGFSTGINEVYKESIFVGYRYYLTAGKEVRYPFGFGLSYTNFEYSGLQVKKSDKAISVTLKLKNVGGYDGAEVVQLYTSAPQSGVFKPLRELRAFKKVYLKSGESKLVSLDFDIGDLRYFDIALNRWALESGEYGIQVCSDCQTVKLEKRISIEGEEVPSPYSEEVQKVYSGADMSGVTDELFQKMSGLTVPAVPPVKPITTESRFTDLKETALGKVLYRAVLGMARKQMRKAKRMPEGAERENAIKGATFLKRILDSGCLRSMSMSSGGRLPYNLAEGLCDVSNGHILRGIKKMCRKIKVPPLPKRDNEAQCKIENVGHTNKQINS